MPLNTRITRTDESFVLNDRGQTLRVYRVSFMVGEDGPFTLDYAPADFVPEKVNADVEGFAAKIEALQKRQ